MLMNAVYRKLIKGKKALDERNDWQKLKPYNIHQEWPNNIICRNNIQNFFYS